MAGTTPVLDTFDRADSTTTLGGNWSLLTDFSIGGTNLGISSNQAYKGGGVGYVVMYWNAAQYGPDCEDYLTLTTLSTDNPALYARAKDAGAATYDSYVLNIDLAATPDTWAIARIDNSVATQLGATINQAVANGEKILLECIGSTLKGFHNTGGGWVEKLSRSDSTYPDAGYLAFYGGGNANTWRYNDFGGGALAIIGTGTPTIGNLALTAAGTLPIQGAAAPTIGNLTLSSAGALAIQGTAAPTIANLTLAAAGDASTHGALNSALGDITLSGTGVLSIVGVGAPTIGDIASSAAGALAIQGVGALTIGAITLASGAAAVVLLPASISGPALAGRLYSPAGGGVALGPDVQGSMVGPHTLGGVILSPSASGTIG